MQEIKFNQLEKIEQELVNEAKKVMKTAYNPYSNFYVGAALLSQKGKIITGSNVENAAYSSTICAERAALLRANALGIRKFETIAIIAKGENFDTAQITGPCGNCRQMLFESSQISNKDMKIILSTTKKDKIIITSIKELLPLAFGPKDLEMNIKK